MTAVPEVSPVRPPKLPKVAERKLRTGLRLLALRKSGVPRFEARLRIPVARPRDSGDTGRQRLLAETLLAGTPSMTSVELARHLQSLGATVNVSTDSEQVLISASGLVGSMGSVFGLLAEVLAEATFPEHEVALQRERVAQELTIIRSQPQTIATEAFMARLYAGHPYSHVYPEPSELGRLTRSSVRSYHRRRVLPRGSTLVIVGDAAPQRMLDLVETALKVWNVKGAPTPITPPKVKPSGPMGLVDRPGSVQTNIRIGGWAIDRRHPDYAALALANTVFGGYFSSRLVENIRERRGYTYSPNSAISQYPHAAHFAVGADVATEVTAPALVEITYELGRMAALPVEQDELDAARRFRQGSLALAIQTQAGLASFLSEVAVFGLGVEYIRDFTAALGRVTVDDAHAAAQAHMSPAQLITVLVGDATAIRGPVAALGELEVH